MAGVSTTIVPQILIAAGASAKIYLYTGDLSECNLCFVSTCDLTIHLADGFGKNQTAASVQEPIPYSLDDPPIGVYISTGGRTYVSMPKDEGVAVTTISPILPRCGPWLEIVMGDREGTGGIVSLLGEV